MAWSLVLSKIRQKVHLHVTTPCQSYRCGRDPAPNKICRDAIKKHIKSYHPQVSHYRKKHPPHRRYLDSCLTITDMWHHYNSNHKKVSYQTYKNAFEEEKITFGPPQGDCDQCKHLVSHLKQMGMSPDALSPTPGAGSSDHAPLPGGAGFKTPGPLTLPPPGRPEELLTDPAFSKLQVGVFP